MRVQDSGIGISADALSKLFRRFYRAQQSYESDIGEFGIGLYVVKEVVSRHGGEISVTSTPGVGGVFTIRLPLLALIGE